MRQSRPRSWVRRLILLALAAGILAASGRIFFEAGKDAQQVWKVLAYPADWRGARFAVSEEFANYLSFLDTVIPPEATLGLPPVESTHWALANTPFMRYFLVPRQVVNCTLENPGCAADLARRGAYLVRLGNGKFPQGEPWSDLGSVVMFNPKWGVWAPEESAELQALTTGPVLIPLKSVFTQVLLGVTCLLLLAAAGAALLGYWLPGLSPASRLALGFGLGVGWLVLSLYLVLLTGAYLSPFVIAASFFTWLLVGGIYGYLTLRRGQSFGLLKRTSGSPEPSRHLHKVDFLWYLPFLALALATSFLAFGQGYHASDEIFIWGAKGAGIALEGLPQGVTNWGTQTTSYPLMIPLWIAAVRAATGDLVAQSKLIFPFFYLGILVLVFEFLRLKLKRWASLLVCLGLAVTPIVLRHAGLAYANLPLTYFLVCGALLLPGHLAKVTNDSQPPSQGVLILSGIFLGLAAWTRPEGVVLSLLVIVSALWVFGKSWRRDRFWKNFLLLSAPLFVFELLKIPQNLLVDSGRLSLLGLLERFLQSLRTGDWHPSELVYLLTYVMKQGLDLRTWGMAGLGIITLLLIGLFSGRPGRDSRFLLLAGGLSGLSILGLYFLLSYEPGHDISWWVTTGLNRMLLPSFVLLWIGGACTLSTGLPADQRSVESEVPSVPTPG